MNLGNNPREVDMVRAVMRNGAIVPLEPIPACWQDGRELAVADATTEPDATESDDDRWARIEATLAEITEEDHQQLERALEEADRQAKEWVRREMGLQQ